MKEVAIILFGIIGGILILLSEKELKFRVEKELLKSNQILTIIKILSLVEIILFGLFILYE